jgi:hypothetical protein
MSEQTTAQSGGWSGPVNINGTSYIPACSDCTELDKCSMIGCFRRRMYEHVVTKASVAQEALRLLIDCPATQNHLAPTNAPLSVPEGSTVKFTGNFGSDDGMWPGSDALHRSGPLREAAPAPPATQNTPHSTAASVKEEQSE